MFWIWSMLYSYLEEYWKQEYLHWVYFLAFLETRGWVWALLSREWCSAVSTRLWEVVRSAWNADGTVASRTSSLLSVRSTPLHYTLLSTNWHADTEIWSSTPSMSRTRTADNVQLCRHHSSSVNHTAGFANTTHFLGVVDKDVTTNVHNLFEQFSYLRYYQNRIFFR